MKTAPILLRYLFIVLSTGLLTWPAPSLANLAAPLNTEQPNIKITSNQMDCNQSTNVCVATGNAVAQKLNDSKTKVLKADQITAYFAKEKASGPLKATRFEAQGNVFFVIGDIVVQGKRSEYVVETEIAKVFDDVKITQGKNQMDGGYAEVNMRTGQYFVKKDKDRVSALIYTKDSPTKGNFK
jgi:lipopolysaccharide transport protein LptA